FWMLPLGLLLLAEDVPALRDLPQTVRNLTESFERRVAFFLCSFALCRARRCRVSRHRGSDCALQCFAPFAIPRLIFKALWHGPTHELVSSSTSLVSDRSG